MTKFEVLGRTISSQYEYTNDALKVTGNYSKNEIGKILSVNGQVYGVSDSHYVGNFRGESSGEEVKYSLSGVSVGDGAAVWQAISDISTRIQAEDAAE